VDKVRQFEVDLLRYVGDQHPEIKKELATRAKIDEAFGSELKKIIVAFKQKMGYGAKAA
jgi:F-type H+-transporting ATPase subunit alpha